MKDRQHRGGRHRGTSRGNRSQDRSAENDEFLRPNRIIKYFSDEVDSEKPIVRRELLDEEAELEALKFVTHLKTTQLRRFYDHVQAIKREIETAKLSDEGIRARLALLKAHAVYASGQKKVPDEFREFIVNHAGSVKTQEDFLYGFLPHFEAVVAYHRFHESQHSGKT